MSTYRAEIFVCGGKACHESGSHKGQRNSWKRNFSAKGSIRRSVSWKPNATASARKVLS